MHTRVAVELPRQPENEAPRPVCEPSLAPRARQVERRGLRTAPLGRARPPRASASRALAWALLAACMGACSVDDRQVSTASDTGGQTPNPVMSAAGGTTGEDSETGAAPESAPGGSSAEAGDPLPPAASAENTALPRPEGECQPGSTRCNSARELAECGVDGAWAAPITCPSVCIEGACTGECVPGSIECLSTIRYRGCSERGVWSPPAECENACVGGACAGECRPGQTRCTSTVDVETCSEQGAWDAPAACDNACVDAACTGECSPGATRCSSETDLQTCGDAGQWQLPTACEHACFDGACGGECSPGERRCNPTSGVPQFCSAEGIWQSQEPCAFICRGSGTCGGECLPGDRRCNPNGVTPQVCSDDGVWQNGDACAFVCSGAGECTGQCSPGGRRCSPTTGLPQRCADDGEWQDQSACLSGQTCADGACLPCQDDGACRLYSCGCSCGVLGINEAEPPCDRLDEVCFVAPCSNNLAICLEGACFLE